MKKILAALSITALIALGSVILAQTETTAAPNEHKMFNPADLKWGDAPPALPAGAKMAVLEGDPTKPGPFTVRLQTPAGYKIPPHTHPTAERITVITGTFRLGMGDRLDEAATKEMTAGGFAVMPTGMKHFAIGSEGTVIQVNSTGPFVINYVNPADDPRNAKK